MMIRGNIRTKVNSGEKAIILNKENVLQMLLEIEKEAQGEAYDLKDFLESLLGEL